MNQFKEIPATELQTNPFQLIGEDWMLVTAKKDDNVNTMTASWGGLGIMWGKNVAFVVIRPHRYTKEFIDTSDTFSLSFFNNEYKKTLGYLGSVSGRTEDKITKSGLTITYSSETPYFDEAKTVILCKKLFAQTYDEKSFIDTKILDEAYPGKDFHTLYIAEITNVLVK